jgi:hypothetical protein
MEEKGRYYRKVCLDGHLDQAGREVADRSRGRSRAADCRQLCTLEPVLRAAEAAGQNRPDVTGKEAHGSAAEREHGGEIQAPGDDRADVATKIVLTAFHRRPISHSYGCKCYSASLRPSKMAHA